MSLNAYYSNYSEWQFLNFIVIKFYYMTIWNFTVLLEKIFFNIFLLNILQITYQENHKK